VTESQRASLTEGSGSGGSRILRDFARRAVVWLAGLALAGLPLAPMAAAAPGGAGLTVMIVCTAAGPAQVVLDADGKPVPPAQSNRAKGCTPFFPSCAGGPGAIVISSGGTVAMTGRPAVGMAPGQPERGPDLHFLDGNPCRGPPTEAP